jgi:hypothetical protein|tara:strand:- start:21178 stop:22215 length:1038 start_codon:yes stop_codon:yes gene_type:complete
MTEQRLSLNVQIPWNIRETVNNNARVTEGIIYHNSLTILGLITRIRETMNVHLSRGYSKFCYILIAMLGHVGAVECKVFKDVPKICEQPAKLAAMITYIYEVYSGGSSDYVLPNIDGFEGPNLDRDVIEALRYANDILPQETVKIYSYAVVFYLYWAYLNGYKQNIREYQEKFDSILNNTQQTIRRVVRPTTVVSNVSDDNTSQLKKRYLEQYQLLCKHEIKKEEECVICLESITYDAKCQKTIEVLDCGHMFHKACINKWRKNSCPTCRNPYRRNSLRRVASQLRDTAREQIADFTEVQETQQRVDRTNTLTVSRETIVVPRVVRSTRLVPRAPLPWQGGEETD